MQAEKAIEKVAKLMEVTEKNGATASEEKKALNLANKLMMKYDISKSDISSRMDNAPSKEEKSVAPKVETEAGLKDKYEFSDMGILYSDTKNHKGVYMNLSDFDLRNLFGSSSVPKYRINSTSPFVIAIFPYMKSEIYYANTCVDEIFALAGENSDKFKLQLGSGIDDVTIANQMIAWRCAKKISGYTYGQVERTVVGTENNYFDDRAEYNKQQPLMFTDDPKEYIFTRQGYENKGDKKVRIRKIALAKTFVSTTKTEVGLKDKYDFADVGIFYSDVKNNKGVYINLSDLDLRDLFSGSTNIPKYRINSSSPFVIAAFPYMKSEIYYANTCVDEIFALAGETSDKFKLQLGSGIENVTIANQMIAWRCALKVNSYAYGQVERTVVGTESNYFDDRAEWSKQQPLTFTDNPREYIFTRQGYENHGSKKTRIRKIALAKTFLL